MGKLLLSLACVVCLAAPASAVTFDWVTVEGAGNPDDITRAGGVAYVYRISRTEVTNAQYAEFLNAVAATDTHELYNVSMGMPTRAGGIARDGNPGSFAYAEIPGRENMPVNYVEFYDALRFVNWLENGQPMGAQDDTTTEDGTYTITEAGIAANSITSNEEATIFLPSEDEWYKAAYYNVVRRRYFKYPAGSDTETTCAVPGDTPNTANCSGVNRDLAEVGSYTRSGSPNGTFDQGGNVQEWTETASGLGARVVRGGAFNIAPSFLAAATRNLAVPFNETSNLGFRVATVPEPSASLVLLLMMCALGLARGQRSRA